MDYTWSQFSAFSAAGARRKKRQQQDLFGLLFIASRGDEKSVSALLKQLEA
ncbi:MAG: hypothetical protein GZ090_01405 [Oxalobacteraceae bacterium]|nr:hypothetical protein [Oxalobacteraceae bacterium]